MTKPISVGIIAEDVSDFECLRELSKKIPVTSVINFKKCVGRGCGRIPAKCNRWAQVLKDSGCSKLIILVDSDGQNVKALADKISNALSPSPIRDHIVVIPVNELESWILSDMNAIHGVFSMSKKKIPAEISNPESIPDAKEHLRRHVKTKYDKQYISTTHNVKIVQSISREKILKKCPSYSSLDGFIASL